MPIALERLKTRSQFLAVAATRRKWAADGLVLQGRPRADGTSHVGIGFTATKKVGNSVVRNRARRHSRLGLCRHRARGHARHPVPSPRRRFRGRRRAACAHAMMARLLDAAVVAYQWTLRPILGANCRYMPSCSEYARDALREHGALAGSALAARRICRCHPWGGFGFDPVPPRSGDLPRF